MNEVNTAMAFLETTRQSQLITKQNRHKWYIISMGQTPYDPHDSAKRTYIKKGTKRILGKEIKTSVGQMTICLVVCTDGHKSPPWLFLKNNQTSMSGGRHNNTQEMHRIKSKRMLGVIRAACYAR